MSPKTILSYFKIQPKYFLNTSQQKIYLKKKKKQCTKKKKKKKETRRSRWCAGNHRHLMWTCQKNEFRGGHLGFLAAILDWQWGLDKHVRYINHLYQFVPTYGKWTIDTPIVIFYHFSQCRPEVVISK